MDKEDVIDTGIAIDIDYEIFSYEKNEILPFATTWMDLLGITLSKISHIEKNKYHMISLICGT